MEEKSFIWDEVFERLILSGYVEKCYFKNVKVILFHYTFYRPSKTENEKNKDNRKKSQVTEMKVYCPHKSLILNFKETLNFVEQVGYYFFRYFILE